VETVEKKAKDLLAQAEGHRELSSSLTHDDTPNRSLVHLEETSRAINLSCAPTRRA
jgi:hypothetical protein